MKLKNLKKEGKKKEPKKEEPKKEAQQAVTLEDEEEQRDDALVDIKEDLEKKEQPKQKNNKRIESNRLEETEIDTSKLNIEKKEAVKAPMTTWVVEEDKVKDILQKDFNMDEVDHEFESLTDHNLNQELKKKKQAMPPPKVQEAPNGIKFANLGGDVSPFENKHTDKLTFNSKPESQTGIGIEATPFQFKNSSLSQNINTTVIEKSPQQLREEEIERKMQEKEAERQRERESQPQANTFQKGLKLGGGSSVSSNTATSATKGGWFKSKQPEKTIEFKSTPLTFTNSKAQQGNLSFKPLEKSKQEMMMEGKGENLKISSKQEVQERKRKQEQEQERAAQNKAKIGIGMQAAKV